MSSYPFEKFPIWHHPYQSLKSKCDFTNQLLFQDMMKVFEPVTLTGLDSVPNGNFKSPTLDWISKRNTFRARRTVINVDYFADAFEVDLDDGIRLLIHFMNPKDQSFDESETFLYLVFIYLGKSHQKKSCPFKEVRRFLSYISTMPKRTIQRVFLRPLEINSFPHFKKLPMIERPKATTERLNKAYKKKFNAYEMEFNDDQGNPYLEIPFSVS